MTEDSPRRGKAGAEALIHSFAALLSGKPIAPPPLLPR